jgi:hypothetical protein
LTPDFDFAGSVLPPENFFALRISSSFTGRFRGIVLVLLLVLGNADVSPSERLNKIIRR